MDNIPLPCMASNAIQQRSSLAPREVKTDASIAPIMVQTATSMDERKRREYARTGFDLQREQRVSRPLVERRERSRRSGGKARSARDDAGAPMPVAPFTMRGNVHATGGKATRVYEIQTNVGNAATSSDGLYFGYSIRNSVVGAGAVPSLNIYVGRADSGSSAALLVDPDFPDEAKHLCDTFKWMNVDKIEMEIVPILQSTATSTNAAAMPNSLDGGIVAFGGHVGNEEYYAAASGVPTLDYENQIRLPHVNIQPIGLHSKTTAKLPQSPEVLDYASGSTHATYPRTPPIQTNVFINNIVEYPFYGHWYYWNHPNLLAAVNLVKFVAKFRFQISWNTVQDTAIALVPAAREKARLAAIAKQLAGTPLPIIGTDGVQRYYPAADQISADLLKSEEPDEPDESLVVEDYVPVTPPVTPRVTVPVKAAVAAAAPRR